MKHFLSRQLMIASLALLTLATTTPFALSQGYDVEYLDSWPLTNQLRFIRVRITPLAGKSKKDIDFHVVSRSTSFQGSGVHVSTMVSIRKGDTFATGELYVPAFGYNNSLHTEVDGNLKYDRGDFALSNYQTNFYGRQFDSSKGASPSFVLASSAVEVDHSIQFTGLSRKIPGDMASYNQLSTTDEFPSLSDVEQWYDDTARGFAGVRKPSSMNGFSSPYATAMSLGALPSKWFAYEGLGMLMISFDDLKLLSKKHPGKLLAIERWVAAAGRLVVLESGDKLIHADESLRLLGDANADVRKNRNTSFLAKEIDQKEIKTALAAVEEDSQQYDLYYQQVRRTRALENNKPSIVIEGDTFENAIGTGQSGDIVSVEFGQGQVIFVSDSASNWEQEQNSDIDRWGNLGLFLRETDRNPVDKHGVLAGGTMRFFGFPEFDEPPRYVFEFSILIYLLAIGPVTFFLLKRKHKLNLMFVIVPIISAVFCTTILAYAIFAEGFDTRANLFTFSSLDQRSGRLTTSSITHVYSGLTPSAYRFSGPSYGLVNFTDGGRIQRLNWSDSGELITGGEIRARTNHQLFGRSSSETKSRLEFSFTGTGDSESAVVRNEFEVPVSAVVFRSESCDTDEAWFCERIDVGQTAVCKKMPVSDIAVAILEINRETMKGTVYASGKTAGNQRNTSGVNSVEQLESVNELGKAWRMSSAEVGQYLRQNNHRNYLAITETSINYGNPVDDAKLEAEMHVVKGIR